MTFFFPAKSLSLNFPDACVLGNSKSGALSPTSSAAARPGRNASKRASTNAWMKPYLFMKSPFLENDTSGKQPGPAKHSTGSMQANRRRVDSGPHKALNGGHSLATRG